MDKRASCFVSASMNNAGQQESLNLVSHFTHFTASSKNISTPKLTPDSR